VVGDGWAWLLKPGLMLQYREPHVSDGRFGFTSRRHRSWRHIAAILQSGGQN
jgi:hypothetical protein